LRIFYTLKKPLYLLLFFLQKIIQLVERQNNILHVVAIEK
jgi:hypothetical protein